MNYCEAIREKIGNDPLIIVRPSVAIMNHNGEILLSRFIGGIWSIPGDILQLNQSVEYRKVAMSTLPLPSVIYVLNTKEK
jgi:hypothetical protein